MISLLVSGYIGRMLAGPLAAIAALVAICACMKCMNCRMRDCVCVKRFLRLIGADPFDDFELMILVHQAIFESKDKMSTLIKVTAGANVVKTEPSSSGVFQQPLHVRVEQGTTEVEVELLDSRRHVLATLSLDVVKHLLKEDDLEPETDYLMKSQNPAIIKPTVSLTMVVSNDGDVEKGLLGNMSTDTDILVRQQLQKAKKEKGGDDHLSEMEVLKSAAAGPLEMFEGLGKTHNVYVAIQGPPNTRRWILGIWNCKKDFDAQKKHTQEIELLKVETIQGDPSRHHVFVINYFDESRVKKNMMFRRTDRARDVWVEILHLLVARCRAHNKQAKSMKGRRSQAFQATQSTRGMERHVDPRINRSNTIY